MGIPSQIRSTPPQADRWRSGREYFVYISQVCLKEIGCYVRELKDKKPSYRVLRIQ